MTLFLHEGYTAGNLDESPAVEAAMNRDRAYFEAHPNATWYVRAVVPGEFGDLPIYGATHVKVVLLGEGFRARIPLWLAVPSGQAADCG